MRRREFSITSSARWSTWTCHGKRCGACADSISCIRAAELLSLDPTLQRAYDPYAFIRDAWVQQREFAIYDGNPPPEVLEEEVHGRGARLKPPQESPTP